MYPKVLEDLIKSFENFPGVGRKTAERYAYFLVNGMNEEKAKEFADSIIKAKTEIKRCKVCGFLTNSDICEYCVDKERDQETVLVVEEPKDVMAIERTGKYKGTYHVLCGSLSPLNGIGPDELNISSLLKRVKNGGIKEVILATGATTGGETTAQYIKHILYDFSINVSRIAYGVPVGSSLEYNDETTISKAIEGRKVM